MSLASHTAYTYSLPPTPRSAVIDRLRPARRSPLMRADALCLVAASVAAFAMKAFGARLSGVGFGEAHELALLAGVLLWHATARRCWHLSAAAVHALLAVANVAHWDTLAASSEAAVVAATTMHVTFVALQLVAAARAR